MDNNIDKSDAFEVLNLYADECKYFSCIHAYGISCEQDGNPCEYIGRCPMLPDDLCEVCSNADTCGLKDE